MANLKLENIKKAYGNTIVIPDIDLEINDAELMVFVGPSGCGKSTLLRMVAGLEEITDGTIKIGDKLVNHVPPAERGIAMVFQSYALYPHKDVYGNMAFALKHAKTSKKIIDERVQRAADILGLQDLLHRKPKDLSGGQRQRVAIGRAIVRDPEVFLFDEPLSNLDAALRVQMRMEIMQLHQRLKTTMIYVTHDQVEAMTLADRICVLREGRIEQIGTPMELYHHPNNLFVAGFIGSPKMNFLNASYDDGGIIGPCGVRYSIDNTNLLPEQKIRLGIRPEHIESKKISRNSVKVTGSIMVVERLGGENYIHLDIGEDEPLVVKTEGDERHKSGDSIELGIPIERLHVFNTDGEVIKFSS